MSKITLEGNASGTGTFTIAAPNSNTSYTLTLPQSTGTVVVTGGAQTIEFAAGSASTPSITFTGDTNTGIFSPAADTIAFAEGGVEAMRLDSAGNMGLGVTPSAWSLGKAIEVGFTGKGIWANNQNEVIYPNNAYFNSGWKYSVSSYAPSQYAQRDGLHAWSTAASGTAGNAITFTQAMTLDTSGNLFLGGTSASMGTPRLFVTGSRATDGVANFQNTTNTGDVNHGTINIINSATGATGNDARVMFSFRQVGATTGLDPMASMGAVKEAGDMAAALQFNTRSASGSYSEKVRIDSSGNLLVGTTTVNGTEILQLKAGGVQWSVGPNTTNGNFDVLNASGTGVYLANGGTSWIGLSDETTKDIIEPIQNAAEKVSSLRAVIGKYKTDEEGVRRSFLIAQDVQAVLPEAVNENYDGKLGLSYTDVIPLLVAAIQELKAINDAQATRIETLETKVAALEAK